jgi:hypothetical protein
MEATMKTLAQGLSMTEGTMKYMPPGAEHSLYRNGKVYMQRDASGDDSTWVGTDLVDHVMTIGDARSLTQNQRKTLAANGFELINTPLGDDGDFFDASWLVNSYYPECEAIVRKITGAKTVKAFDHNIRSAQGKNSKERLNNGQNVQGPVHVVHGDYTLTSSLDRLRQLCEPPRINDTYAKNFLPGQTLLDPEETESAIRNGRVAIINLWRSIAPEPVEVNPLAVCDSTSVIPEDLVVFEIRYADRIGENYFVKYSPSHDWWFYPRMNRNEALLIKQWDSHGGLAKSQGSESDADLSTFSFHTAFEDPMTRDDAPDRRSIEVRCAVIY